MSFDSAEQARATPGRRFGRYVLARELGRGAMGVVYRAHDTALGQDVALKVLLVPASDDDDPERFRREWRATMALSHPGIVRLLDGGEQDGRRYVSMELVDGASLDSMLEKQGLALRRKVEIVRDVARALAHAHGRGVVHRDVKPANIMIDREGHARLLDFGLARGVDDKSFTASGQILGTALYMSPEQAGGERKKQGPHSDVYALGALLYHALVGRPPFAGESLPEIVKRILLDAPVPPRKLVPSIPAALEALVLRCLAKEPEHRPGAGEAAFDLENYLTGKAGSARPRTRRVLVPLLLVTGVALPATFAAWTLHGAPEPSSQRAAADPPKAVEVTPKTAAAWAERAARRVRGDLDGAIVDATRAIELDPTLVSAWLNRGVARDMKDDAERAIADETRAIELDPTLALAWAVRGHARAERGDQPGAIEDSTRAIELDPTLAFGWATRAIAREHSNDPDGAIADCTHAIELDPGKLAWAWGVRATARERKGDLEGAIEDCTRAVEIDPKLGQAWTVRGLARQDRGDREGAIADFTRAIELDARLARAWAYRGTARADSGDLDGAIADCTRAIEADPGFVLAWGNRGVARGQKGDRDGAIADYERFLELAPGDRHAPAVRAFLAAERAKGVPGGK